jgi:rhamnosyltransferase
MPQITVLLRTLDAGGDLPPLMSRLLEQTLKPLEILVVDSGSTDGTRQRAVDAGARVVDIAPGDFTHARSTNLGFREARGEIVAMLSQDALPVSPAWLETLVAPLLRDETTAAAFGRQLARPGYYPLERWELERCYPDRGEPAVVYSNVNSAARRRDWEETPFPGDVLFAEDRFWALGRMRLGRRIAYVPEAVVLHSHAYSLGGVYRRCRAEAEAKRRREGYAEPWRILLTAWPKQTLADARRLAAEGQGRRWPHAALYRFAQFAGIVAGSRA